MLFFVYNVQGGNIPLHNYHLLTPGDAEALLFLFVNPTRKLCYSKDDRAMRAS